MARSEPTTVIFSLNLGSASKYEKDIFPLAYHDAGNTVEKGRLLLSATLDEMVNIAEMGIDFNTDKRVQSNARYRYEVSGDINVSFIDLLMYWYRQSSS